MIKVIRIVRIFLGTIILAILATVSMAIWLPLAISMPRQESFNPETPTQILITVSAVVISTGAMILQAKEIQEADEPYPGCGILMFALLGALLGEVCGSRLAWSLGILFGT